MVDGSVWGPRQDLPACGADCRQGGELEEETARLSLTVFRSWSAERNGESSAN